MAMKMKGKEFRNPMSASAGCNLRMHSKKLYLEVFMISRNESSKSHHLPTYLPNNVKIKEQALLPNPSL
jgi:hypothetical protein